MENVGSETIVQRPVGFAVKNKRINIRRGSAFVGSILAVPLAPCSAAIVDNVLCVTGSCSATVADNVLCATGSCSAEIADGVLIVRQEGKQWNL